MATLSCPVPGCYRPRNRNHMMCRVCWSHVTPETRSAVYQAWRRYSRAAKHGAADFGEAHDIYYAIRERAIREAEA